MDFGEFVDDSATVKTFYKEAGHIRLQPENDTMDPIIVADCQILGVVFGVFRFFLISVLIEYCFDVFFLQTKRYM